VAEPAGDRLRLPELELGFRRFGRPGGAPVLALHGWLDNANTWSGLGPHLDTFDVVALDLPGHGLSDRRVQGPYHFIDMVADAIAAADALGWSTFGLLGHSMGAGIASLVAGTVPERIRAAALIEGLGPLVEVESEAPARLARSLASEAAKRRPKLRSYPSVEDAAARLADATGISRAGADALVARGLAPVADGYTWRADPRLRIDSRLRMTEAHVLAFLRRITAPTLLVAAENGWPYDPATMRTRVEAVPRIEVVRLAGRHHLHLDTPELVAPHVTRVLSA
jgi:pimeloyl-ACP methyl ester carboxylesterase